MGLEFRHREELTDKWIYLKDMSYKMGKSFVIKVSYEYIGVHGAANWSEGEA